MGRVQTLPVTQRLGPDGVTHPVLGTVVRVLTSSQCCAMYSKVAKGADLKNSSHPGKTNGSCVGDGGVNAGGDRHNVTNAQFLPCAP